MRSVNQLNPTEYPSMLVTQPAHTGVPMERMEIAPTVRGIA